MDLALALGVIATAATVVGVCIQLVQWIHGLLETRRVQTILRVEEGSRDRSTVPTLGRGPAIDTSLHRSAFATIRFGVMPYIDHSQAFVAHRLGWFEEAGIRVTFKTYTPGVGFDALERGDIDVLSETPSGLIRRGTNNSNAAAFVLHDLFVGYGLMCRRRFSLLPPRLIRSYSEWRSRGLSHEASLSQVARLLSGATVAHSSDDAIRPFLHRILAACPDASPFRSVQTSEIDTVKTAVKGKADFQVGGVPTRLMLERRGFRALVSTIDLLTAGVLLHDSVDYLTLIQCGWFAKGDWIRANDHLVMRLASVSYRLSRFIQEQGALAARIHGPFLNDIAETALTAAEVQRAYAELHPFKTYEEQLAWFTDQSNPFFVPTIISLLLGHWKDQLPTATFDNLRSVEDVVIAGDVHNRMSAVRAECVDKLNRVRTQGLDERNEAVVRSAVKLCESYNFVDAAHLLDACLQGQGAVHEPT